MAKAFSQFGIEIEYMIVDRERLEPSPLADRLLRDESGTIVNSLGHGPITWSNELVMHVLEFKTSGPVKSMDGLEEEFHQSMLLADNRLGKEGAGLLGTAMHPWFNPHEGVSLWKYDDCDIYDAFDRIFDSRGHGWSNLQSFHLNLPFEVGDDDSFRRLHSAIRLVLPLVPALSASSPFLEGGVSGMLDTRLEKYRKNCARIPSISGGVIPDVYRSQAEYKEQVLDVIERDLKPHDPEGILEPEWTNARGAIARFDRGSIEIRVGDVQECPRQDIAVIQMLGHLVKQCYEESHVSLLDQEQVPSRDLRSLFDESIIKGRNATIELESLQRAYGLKGPISLGKMLEKMIPKDDSWSGAIWTILHKGSLAERLLGAVGHAPNEASLKALYQRLRVALLENKAFEL